jgi:hypothetical protein
MIVSPIAEACPLKFGKPNESRHVVYTSQVLATMRTCVPRINACTENSFLFEHAYIFKQERIYPLIKEI